jgi:hypothetical protein
MSARRANPCPLCPDTVIVGRDLVGMRRHLNAKHPVAVIGDADLRRHCAATDRPSPTTLRF